MAVQNWLVGSSGYPLCTAWSLLVITVFAMLINEIILHFALAVGSFIAYYSVFLHMLIIEAHHKNP